MAIKVTLREKSISKGRKSLFLDFYPAIKLSEPKMRNGELITETRREFLGMYILAKPRTHLEREANKETLKMAEGIRLRREVELSKPEVYFESEKEFLRIKALGEQCFVAYFKEQAEKRENSTYSNWMSAYKYLYRFTKGTLKFADLNEKFLEDFKEYLLSTNKIRSKKSKLSQNTASSYFIKVKVALKQAFIDGILQTNLNDKIKPIKELETKREYLTEEEINDLVATPCKKPILKEVALFSILTGFASMEIKNMTWADITKDGDVYVVFYKRQKSKRDNYVYISKQAYSLTKGVENPRSMPQEGKVFKGYKPSAYQDKFLKKWIKDAGITKKITFHNFRHTYATLQLANGTDIYTVSKILGHKFLKTTEIYAKVVDKSKREATNKIVLNLDNYKL